MLSIVEREVCGLKGSHKHSPNRNPRFHDQTIDPYLIVQRSTWVQRGCPNLFKQKSIGFKIKQLGPNATDTKIANFYASEDYIQPTIKFSSETSLDRMSLFFSLPKFKITSCLPVETVSSTVHRGYHNGILRVRDSAHKVPTLSFEAI